MVAQSARWRSYRVRMVGGVCCSRAAGRNKAPFLCSRFVRVFLFFEFLGRHTGKTRSTFIPKVFNLGISSISPPSSPPRALPLPASFLTISVSLTALPIVSPLFLITHSLAPFTPLSRSACAHFNPRQPARGEVDADFKDHGWMPSGAEL